MMERQKADERVRPEVQQQNELRDSIYRSGHKKPEVDVKIPDFAVQQNNIILHSEVENSQFMNSK